MWFRSVLGVVVLIWVGTPCGVSSLCHDDLDHGVIVRVGFVPGIRFW